MFQKVQRSFINVPPPLSNKTDASSHVYDETITVNYQEKTGQVQKKTPHENDKTDNTQNTR